MIDHRPLMRQIILGALASSTFWTTGCGSTRRVPASARANPGSARLPATDPTFTISATPGRLVGVPGPAQSDFEITFDAQAMAKAGVSPESATQGVNKFFTTYPFFSLTDLMEAKVSGTNGESIQLRKIATIDVWFGVARTEIVDQTKAGPQ